MKQFWVLLSRLLALMTLATAFVACSVEDNKLNIKNQNRNSSSGSGATAGKMRVGSYGLPLFTAQNLEQVGALIAQCAASEAELYTEVVNNQPRQVKACFIHVGQDLTDEQMKANPKYIKEDWQVKVYTDPRTQALYEANGLTMNARESAVFQSKPVELKHTKKEFVYKVENSEAFIEMGSSGFVPSENAPLEFGYNVHARVQMKDENNKRIWNVLDTKFIMNLPDRNISFESFFQSLNLVWSTSQCADFSGEAKTKTSTDKDFHSISLDGERMVLKSGRQNWEQSFLNCQKRQEPIRNIEYLFM